MKENLVENQNEDQVLKKLEELKVKYDEFEKLYDKETEHSGNN